MPRPQGPVSSTAEIYRRFRTRTTASPSVWTVSLGNLRIQNIFGGFHVRSQPSSSVEEVFDDLLVSHTTRTEPVLPIRLSSRQPILQNAFQIKKGRRPALRRERAVRRGQTS